MPKFLAVSILLAVALCACSKGSRSSSSAAPAETANGASIYIANCASCHQPNGQGLTGTFPPLAGSQIVNGDSARVIHIVKYGLTGRLAVLEKPYNGMMPAWSPTLSDDAIATVLTYVRSTWGNHAGAITAAQVTAISK
jgi:mono/diheme cytochrome c family protein